MTGWRGTARVLMVLVLALAGCAEGGDGHGPSPSATSAPASVPADTAPATVPRPAAADISPDVLAQTGSAIDQGAAYAADHLGDADPVSVTVYDYLYRNWDLQALEGARAAARGSLPEDPSYSMFARLVDADALPPDESELEDVSQLEGEVMAAAMYCDQVPLDEGFADAYRSVLAEGRRGDLAHVAYAVGWVRELGCVAPGMEGLTLELVSQLASDLGGDAVIDDESLSSSAALGYLGRADLIPEPWVEATLAAQRGDGGWAERVDSDGSSWHTTGLALWTLAAVTGPGNGVTMLGG